MADSMVLYYDKKPQYYREKKDPRARLEEMVFRDLWVCQDLEDLLDHLERMETR